MKQEQLLGSAVTWAQINAVAAKARAAATALAIKTAAAVATRGQHIGINPSPSPEGSGAGTDPVDPKLRDLQNNGFGLGGGPNPREGNAHRPRQCPEITRAAARESGAEARPTARRQRS